MFSDFVYAICQAQLCLYSLFEYDVLMRIWLHSRRGEELCSRQEHIFNVRSHTHTQASRLSSAAIPRCSAAQLEVSKLGQGLLRQSVSSTYTTHAHGDTHSTLAFGVLELFMKEQDKKLQMRLCRPALKHIDFSLQEDDAPLNLCHYILFEIKRTGKVLCTK